MTRTLNRKQGAVSPATVRPLGGRARPAKKKVKRAGDWGAAWDSVGEAKPLVGLGLTIMSLTTQLFSDPGKKGNPFLGRPFLVGQPPKKTGGSH